MEPSVGIVSCDVPNITVTGAFCIGMTTITQQPPIGSAIYCFDIQFQAISKHVQPMIAQVATHARVSVSLDIPYNCYHDIVL
jgi:hypothetical protein